MKQYKLSAWPDLPARLQKTTNRRVVSELSQRFSSVRDLARSSGAAARDVEDLLAVLQSQGILMVRDAPMAAGSQGWSGWGPVVAFRDLVRAWR